jgi:8-oxo-dGTP diphosphatase
MVVYLDLMPFDFTNWTPKERATLLFVVEEDRNRILLINKKRGLGGGLVNGPGGRLEVGETPIECAVRECQEELGITPVDPVEIGTLMFQFVGNNKLSGHSILGYVFRATKFEGEPTETGEAAPLWTPLDAIPYDRMWQDDKLWLPDLIASRKFVGQFVFDDQTMLEHRVTRV